MMSNVNTFHVIKDIGLDPRVRMISIRAVVISKDQAFSIKDRYTGQDKQVMNFTLSDSTGIVKFGVFGKDKIQLFSRILEVGKGYNFFNLKIPNNSKHKTVNSGADTTVMPSDLKIEHKIMREVYDDLSVLKYHEIPNVSINVKAKVYMVKDVIVRANNKIKDIQIIDGFGSVMIVTIWNKDIDQFKDFKYNDTLLLKGVVIHYNDFLNCSFVNFPSGATVEKIVAGSDVIGEGHTKSNSDLKQIANDFVIESQKMEPMDKRAKDRILGMLSSKQQGGRS